jgi:hypothetical protein
MRNKALWGVVFVSTLATAGAAQMKSPAEAGFERLKTLQGDWLDVDGVFGEKGKVAVTYRVSGGGNTVIESFPVGTPFEMVTVYHKDGAGLALTHFCAGGTQPRMTSKGLDGNALVFDFAGGTNIDPNSTSHMHSARLEFISADEFKGTWQNWKDGKPEGPPHGFRVVRKK